MEDSRLVREIIINHPQVASHINFGLAGRTMVDHLIGLVESALQDRPHSFLLQDCYLALQRLYPSHFSDRDGNYVIVSRERKQ